MVERKEKNLTSPKNCAEDITICDDSSERYEIEPQRQSSFRILLRLYSTGCALASSTNLISFLMSLHSIQPPTLRSSSFPSGFILATLFGALLDLLNFFFKAAILFRPAYSDAMLLTCQHQSGHMLL